MARRVPLPQSLVWELSARCNLQCGHCYNLWTAPGCPMPAELDTAEAMRVLENISAVAGSLKSLTVTGGEPLLRPDLLTILAEAKRLLPKTQLTVATNGLLLTAEKAVAMKQSGVKSVQLTLLAARPELHDRLTVRAGAFQQTLQAIAVARSAGLLVAVFFVATRQNISEWPGTAKLAMALGADTVVFNRFQPGGRGLAAWKELTPSLDQLKTAMAQSVELRPIVKASQGTLIPPCELPGRSWFQRVQRCPIGTANAYPAISPDGRLRPCNHTPVTAGSLLELPLAELMQQPCMGRPDLAQLPRKCADCRWVKSCRGGCPAAQALAGEMIYNCQGQG